MAWPNDADGDVLRRLEASGFDFSRSHTVDFNVDFTNWPPADQALEILTNQFEHVEIFEPEESFRGYALIKIDAVVTYEFVVGMQSQISGLMKPFGGECDSWGVLH